MSDCLTNTNGCSHWANGQMPEWLMDWWINQRCDCEFDCKNCWLNIKEHFETYHSMDEIYIMALVSENKIRQR